MGWAGGMNGSERQRGLLSRIFPLCQGRKDFPPTGVLPPAHTLAVGNDSLAVKGYFGGLDGYIEVGQQLPGGYGYRPGLAAFPPVIFQRSQILNDAGVDAHGIKGYFRGIIGIDGLQPLQLSGADRSSGGPEKQESGPLGGD